jgi:phage protein D
MVSFRLLPDVYVPTFDLRVGGSPLARDVARSILDVSITEQRDLPGHFSFRLNDPTLRFIDGVDATFTEGKQIEIILGYVGRVASLIVGEISALSADFPTDGPATLEVEGFDLLHRLHRGTVYRRWGDDAGDQGLADSEIVTRIANEMGLQPSVDPTPPRTEARVQDHQSNLAFVQGLAQENGFALWVEGTTLHFRRTRPPRPGVELEWGKTLSTFSPRLSTVGQVTAVEVRGWDPLQKERVAGRAERAAGSDVAPAGQEQLDRGAGGRSELVLTNPSITSAADALTAAETILREQEQALITGNGSAVGNPDLRIGTPLTLRGIGRFSGTYEVEQVSHTVGGGGYTTTFQVRRARP